MYQIAEVTGLRVSVNGRPCSSPWSAVARHNGIRTNTDDTMVEKAITYIAVVVHGL